jgi:hypothetical protein
MGHISRAGAETDAPRSLDRAATAAGAVVALVAFASLCAVAAMGKPAWLPPWSSLAIPAAGLAAAGIACCFSALAASASRAQFREARRAFDERSAAAQARERELVAASRENETILGALRFHLMLIDSSYLIRSRYSGELESVFHQSELAHENFLNLLKRVLSEQMFQTARDYLTLLFDVTKKERTVLKVNPLDEVEIETAGPNGAPTLRYLSFGFRRILEDGAVGRVLVTVEDVTERSVRMRMLRDSEAQKVKQFELLLGILHVGPRELDGFVALVKEQLGLVDEALRATDFAAAAAGRTSLLFDRLDGVLQRVHNIKGNASLLRLEYFERKAQIFEQQIVDLRHRPALGGDDFLTVVIGSSEFRADLDALQALRSRLAAIERSMRMADEVGDDLIASVAELAATLAKRLDRPVAIDADGFDSRALPPDRRLVVKDVLIQLTRNSLVHGIEPTQEREAAGKPAIATIEIRPMPDAPPESFGFVFRDDGRGLDADRIRSRAVAVGLLDAADAASVDDSEVAGFIFSPGFSTTPGDAADGGRGMGMNVIKQRVVDDCGGEIAVDSDPGQFCEFTFVVPMRAHAIAS